MRSTINKDKNNFNRRINNLRDNNNRDKIFNNNTDEIENKCSIDNLKKCSTEQKVFFSLFIVFLVISMISFSYTLYCSILVTNKFYRKISEKYLNNNNKKK